MTDTPTTVHQLVADLKASIGGVGKHGKADPKMGGYKYQSIEDIIQALSPHLCRLGLTLRSELAHHKMDVLTGGKTDGEAHSVHVRYTWLGPAGDQLYIGEFLGEAHEFGGDKGANKAMTAARKLMLREHLLLTTNDDVDSESAPPPPDAHRQQQPRHRDDDLGDKLREAARPKSKGNEQRVWEALLAAAGGDAAVAEAEWKSWGMDDPARRAAGVVRQALAAIAAAAAAAEAADVGAAQEAQELEPEPF